LAFQVPSACFKMTKKPLPIADFSMSPGPNCLELLSDAPSASGWARAAAALALPYETMFLASPLPASVSGLRDGRLIAVNDAWLAMTGMARDAVIGRTTVELGLWPTQAQRQAFAEQIVSAGEPQRRYLLRLAGGLDHSVRIHSVKIEAEPEPLLLAFIVEATREVEAQSARERREAALLQANRVREQRLELHAALEKLAHVGYWTHDEYDHSLFWSPGLYAFTGLATDRPLLRDEVRSHIHPDDLPAWMAAREACDFREVECRWLHPDGRVLWFRTRIGQTAVACNLQTDFGVVQDITAEREARERLKVQLNLLENIAARVPGLVYRIQLWPDGRSEISYVNDRGRDMLEVAPAELRRDARQSFLRVHPEDRKSVQRSLEQAAKSLTVWRQDYRVCLSGGRTRWYSVEAVPQAEADGSVVLHGFTTDVTEARLASQRLQRQHRMLDAVREAQALYIEIDDKRRTFEGLLAAFIRLTNSGYGFVGEVFYNEDGTPYLRTQAIENRAWDEPSRLFYGSQMDAGMAFRNLRTLFGQAMVTGQPVIANDPRQDSRSGGMPAGHPPMDAFLCIPLTVGDRVVALIGLASQPGGYSLQDVEFLQPLLGTVRQLVLAWRGHAERQRTLVELERTSRQLAEKSETLQATLDSISQGLSKVDASGRVLIYNQQMLALLDLSDAFMGSQPTHEEIVRFQRERGDFGADMELVEPKALSYLVQPGGMASPDKYWRKTSDGRTLEVRSRHLADGGMVRTFADVTSYIEVQDALQEERQRLAWVLEATRPGIWERSLDTGALRINERWAEMLGHTLPELEPIEQATWLSRVHPEDLPRVRGLRDKHLSGELPFYDCDLRLRHKDGHWVWINSQGRVHQRDAQGRPIFMSGIHLDISDRVAAQEEVLALNASLEQRVSERTAALERSLRDMEAISYSIAHDLRAPLRSVNGFSAVIAEEIDPPLSPVASDMFARINIASCRMGQMLTDMLELLRVVRADLAAVPIDLESLARAVAEELAQEAPQAEISIGPLPTVLGDATLLRQMLHNLMENALKYARHRTPPRLALDFDDSAGAFCLSDNGMGFDMAQAGKLFGLFQRLHAGTDVPGTGVGLAIVARIIERHGGRIWAEAQPNVGAKFWWTLPRQ
jgi:PAS domain S-box-containing protein